MEIAFQLIVPGYNYDIAHAGKGPSDGWMFLTTYNVEQAHTLKEVNSSQRDKDFIARLDLHTDFGFFSVHLYFAFFDQAVSTAA